MANSSQEIETEARQILGAKYVIADASTIPSPKEVAYGAVGKKFKASVFSIDIRNSSQYLSSGDLQSGKIHKSFLKICAETIHWFDGQVRSFNGDGLLAFWEANTQDQLTKPVRAAMGIKWLITEKLSDLFIKKHSFDFGIGLSWGNITCFRAGAPYVEGGNDLVFVDRAINEAVVIAKQANSPNHIESTVTFYNNLQDGAKIGSDKKNMWKDGNVKWKNGDFVSKLTSYHWEF
jgi:adenylate cyclase